MKPHILPRLVLHDPDSLRLPEKSLMPKDTLIKTIADPEHGAIP